MTRRLEPPSPAALARIRDLADRPLSAEEFAARLAIPISEEERRETRQLIEWFQRRYPTPHERLRSARRLYRDWSRSIPH
jgi:hypothetical protein